MSLPFDAALTASLSLGPPDSKSAVLLLHGFTGSPWELRPLAEALAARGHAVTAPLLPGHGGSPEAMMWVGWRDWLGAADDALRALEAHGYERIAVGGLSMGALLSLILASRHRPRVSRLVLLAPVMKLQGAAATMLRLIRHRRIEPLRARWLVKVSSDIEDDAVRAQSPVLPRYPVTRLLDLFTLQDVARLAVPLVKAPALIAAAVHDHVVVRKEVERLHRDLLGSKYVLLQHGFHILPRDSDRARLISEVCAFLEEQPL